MISLASAAQFCQRGNAIAAFTALDDEHVGFCPNRSRAASGWSWNPISPARVRVTIIWAFDHRVERITAKIRIFWACKAVLMEFWLLLQLVALGRPPPQPSPQRRPERQMEKMIQTLFMNAIR